ncbi:biotin carboxylase [Nitzschia inconspicua]|uniref:Biotin carboxylase n=1 Tax=Nitzschia inconspicua TaxID=303405 RepID=A0A9K3L4C0_9STRA|nr:biotin carboxylase [Nitzschia inconspicua]
MAEAFEDGDDGAPNSPYASTRKSVVDNNMNNLRRISSFYDKSQASHRWFPSVQEYVEELGGSKSFKIEKILIANNGVAAVKAIRSIRKWAYEVFGNERAIQFVVMATPEDLRANAEYIRMGDVIIDVPGGSNNHNYANVTLIVELARLHGVQAVWAGWGHASENPLLPDTLHKSTPPIKFIGPAGPPMRALGDKIGSTIIAQSAGVSCIDWNGSDVKAEYNKATGSLPESAYEQASIHSATQASDAAAKIGFPIMIKASEGGGGKGIRRVEKLEDVPNAYRQVCGEVPGSPIFIMKLSANSRHLEVQLLADEYGNAIALNGRDCSVQRRHQKIIEEGPPVAADPSVWTQMEDAAVALAKAVGYVNAGTVEYLYNEENSQFFFLELNPRLQVEHPVTEMITKVNLPAAQLQVAMGIPLDNIPEIRSLYGRNRFEDDPSAKASRIDFTKVKRLPAVGHCIAVRITAENAEAGFKPTSGGIQELNFRSTPNVWGYFSMDSSGSIHEFADSQFGHLFASGSDREQARRNMVLALKELSIRGDISTTIDYISRLIELDDFIENKIDTAWLDGIIKDNVEGIGGLESKNDGSQKRSTLAATSQKETHLSVAVGAAIVAFDNCRDAEKQFLDLLAKGQLPPRSLLKMTHPVELILNGIKYKLLCTRKGQSTFKIGLDNADIDSFVMTNVRLLSDGGYLIEIGGQSHVAYLTSKGDVATGMRLNIAGSTIAFSPDYDPTSLRTDVAGKLVKRLVPDGARVKKGEPYAEIEVMKMFMPLKVEEAGVVEWQANEGAALAPGDLLATLELENPENVTLVSIFEGNLEIKGWGSPSRPSNAVRPHLVLRAALEELNGAMSGYRLSQDEVDKIMEDLGAAVTDSSLPMLEIDEQLSVLSGRIPAKLFDAITKLIQDFRNGIIGQGKFPADQVVALLDNHSASLADASEKSAFSTLTAPLRSAAVPYTRSKAVGVQGAEKVLLSFIEILRRWISIERWFCAGPSYADSVENIRRVHKEDTVAVLNICRSHEQLKTTSYIITRIMSAIDDGSRVDLTTTYAVPMANRLSIVAGAESLQDAFPAISEVGMMGHSADYADVALKARKLLLQESMPSLEQRKSRVLEAAKKLAESDTKEADDLLADQTPVLDVFFPLLKKVSSSKEEVGLLELYARRLYRTYTIKETERLYDERCIKFSFLNKASERVLHKMTSVNSMTELTSVVSSSNLTTVSDSTEGESGSKVLSTENLEKVPSNIVRTGVCQILDRVEDIDNPSLFESLVKKFPASSNSSAGPVNVLYLIVSKTDVEYDENASDVIAETCHAKLIPYKHLLEAAHIRRVTISFNRQSDDGFESASPATFTYRSPSFGEESLIRSIDPSHAIHLDLGRVAVNFTVRSLAARHTPTSHIHLYEATPRSSALAKDKKANENPRIFVRALSFSLDFSSSSFERILVDALNSLDLCSENRKADNHLFVNLVSDFEKVVLDPVVVEQVVVDILKRHGERVSNLGIVEVETKILCALSRDSLPISLRLVASNPTGYVHVMNTYVEAAEDNGSDRVFKLIGGTKASLAGAGDSSWEGLNVNTPYPLTRPFDHQRGAALRSSDTLYCYDLPALFEAAVEEEWVNAAKNGGVRGGNRPLMVMYTTELVVKNANSADPDEWTIQDYLNGDLELVHITRGAGANDVGMVAWLMELRTVEYPQGRQVVLIANDITYKAGSFGTREDVVFKLASELARKMRIPRLFVAANSGARIGLADSVKSAFKVAFKNPAKPENGFNFIYVTKDDYNRLNTDKQRVQAELASYQGEDVYRVTDIIGSEPDLGVENLKGSGLIAGETSSAYNDIFTMTIVLGRTVGIGAYLVRLGQRTIQKTTGSPIILTGYQALNKLMGVDVYSTNDQLGGPGIMYSNGVSHLAEPDHLRAVKAAINWLAYVPSYRGGLLPITDIRGIDSIERPIDFCPVPGTPYDPRMLLAGGEDDSGNWMSGFFDKGSFKETLAGWAKTVVVGRARLGGIPMGVVITENRTAENVKPADPADVKASEAIIQEAGCVWFPNSAYKTAQAINDFRTEDLPLIVFANWRGFSGGQRDMFDEVLKYGSLIVDAFVAYEQPVFVFIPPFAEIRGGAWVVLDASINANVMEMYAAAGSARGGVLEANGAASVKYRTKDLIATMHRLDSTLIDLEDKLANRGLSDVEKKEIKNAIVNRERALLPVYEQISVQFCELHDTPGRMEAVGVIRKQVEWRTSRSFFYWRLRRKLAEFDLRKKIIEASEVGRGVKSPTPLEASDMIRQWFMEVPGMTHDHWEDDKVMLTWMAENNARLESKVVDYTQECVVEEVMNVMTAGGNTAKVGTSGIVEGIGRAMATMTKAEKDLFKAMLAETLEL